MIWITIPTYNEAENIAALLHQIRTRLPDVVVAVVDDGSPDGTADIVAEVAKADERVVLIRRKAKRGYASAIVCGIEEGQKRGARFLGQMDADFSHDPERIPAFLHHLQQNADLVVGSRYIPGGGVDGWSLGRELLSRTANRLVQAVLRIPVRDATSGFRFYRSEALERLGLHRLGLEGYGFLYASCALAVWEGLTVREVPILFRDRTRGKSKLSRKIIWEASVALCKIWLWRRTGRWIGRPLIEMSPRSTPKSPSATLPPEGPFALPSGEG